MLNASFSQSAAAEPLGPLDSTLDTVPEPDKLMLRLPAVLSMTGLGRSTIYRMMAKREFPCPVRIAKRAVAWRRADVARWSDTRPPAGG